MGTVIHGDTVASGTAISPDLFGAFFEDLSHAADGGLYAELIQNRSFAYSRADRLDWHALTAWEVLEREGAAGAVAVSAEAPLHPANPQHAVLHTTATGTAASAPGCATRASTASPSRKVHSTTSVSTPGSSDGTAVRLVAVIESRDGERAYAEGGLRPVDGSWERHASVLTCAVTDPEARFTPTSTGVGTGQADLVSLFPQATFWG
ncbi:hypothetical protein ABIE67_007567 [Streptomyces sp. V4I8]